jgi:chemotaxis protein CheD
MVRMGELMTSTGEELVCVGLGSCIGLLLIQRRTGAVGLAHVMLPSAGGRAVVQPAKYADTVLPALLGAMGASAFSVDAVLVGGASMFGPEGAGQDVGPRNVAAVRATLGQARIQVLAADTGGARGRTMRVLPGRPPTVTVRHAGAAAVELALDRLAVAA